MTETALKIGEVARRTGLSVRTLRHYDGLGLLVPGTRTDGAHRLYTSADVRRLLAIQHLKALGLCLADVRSALDDPAFDAAVALADHIAAVEERLTTLRDLLARLRDLQGAAEAGWEEVLAVIALTERLHHPEPAVRVRAALDGATTAPLDALLDQLAGEPDPTVAATLTWAVARHGPEAVGPVCDRLANPDPLVRVRMVHALAKVADSGAVPALVAALADDDARVASAAVFALGRIAHPAALGSLIGQLGGADPESLTDAISRFGVPAISPLAQALGNGSPRARRHAAEVLGSLGDAAAPALADALADDDGAVRLAAVLALGRLPGEVADAAIRRAVSADDPRVRGVAARLVADRAAGSARRSLPVSRRRVQAERTR